MHSNSVPGTDLVIPLTMRGVVISGFLTRIPTDEELDDVTLQVALTSDVDWDPYATEFAEREVSNDEDRNYWSTNSAFTVGEKSLRFSTNDPDLRLLEISLAESNNLADRLIAAVRSENQEESDQARLLSCAVNTLV